MFDYLKNKVRHDNVKLIWNERSQGHGINIGKDKVPKDTDLLLLIDSSTSDVRACKLLSKTMDVVILDHHQPENENPYALIVNPQLDNYPNKSISATLVTYKLIELMDYQLKKNKKWDYIDMVGMSLLSDQMDMTVLENRYFVKKAFKYITNVGLYALIHASRNGNKRLNSQIFNYDIIPVLNTTARNDELGKAFQLLLEKDFFKAKRMAEVLIEANKERKKFTNNLASKYIEAVNLDDKIALVVTDEAYKGYNGLAASEVASKLRRPCLVLKDNGNTYSGSGRSYNGFNLRKFLQNSGLVEYAAGHAEAFGVSVKAENFQQLRKYINENIDESLFEPVIEYDIELNEDELNWDIVERIVEWDELWGNNNPPVTVRLNNVFVEDRELFPKQNPEHVKIIADRADILKFYDPDYASDVDGWDTLDVIASIGINERKGVKRIQLFVDDYILK